MAHGPSPTHGLACSNGLDAIDFPGAHRFEAMHARDNLHAGPAGSGLEHLEVARVGR